MVGEQDAEPYDYGILDAPLTEQAYPRLWATLRRDFDLPENVLLRIAAVVLGTCGECGNGPADCQCWNDE